jgi:hypothetical protein
MFILIIIIIIIHLNIVSTWSWLRIGTGGGQLYGKEPSSSIKMWGIS